MLELLMTVCLASAPQDCREVRLNFAADNTSPMQCMLYGQMEIAKWIEEHPAFQIKKWRCGQANQTANL